MKKFSLTQDWVSRVAADDSLQLSVVGVPQGAPPTEDRLRELMDNLSRTETVREMSRRKWLEPTTKGQVGERSTALLTFLTGHAALRPALALFKGQRPGQRPLIEAVAVQAWLAHVADTARRQPSGAAFKASSLNTKFLSSLARLSTRLDGPRLALDAVREIGIHVVVEGALPGMSVDGASFHHVETGPVIALTVRHDRLDNFWFTLLHEVGHVGLHLEKPSDEVFVDAEEEDQVDFVEAEAEANAFAKDALIPRDIWLRSSVHRLGNEAAVIALAHRVGVHPAIVAGRIRFERREFRIFNDLLGRDQVREVIFATA